MRVIAGKYRARTLRSIPGLDLRPTSDRLRETLFNVLTAGNPSALEGTIWIDLYAGTGAVGIEAISRGAKTVYFVDEEVRAAATIQQNLRALQILPGRVPPTFEVMKLDARKALKALENKSVSADFVFLDPPYKLEAEYQKILQALAESPLLKPESSVIAEHFKKFDPGDEFDGLRRYRKLKQGDSILSFYRPSFYRR